jgi:hypothetical protein
MMKWIRKQLILFIHQGVMELKKFTSTNTSIYNTW